MSELSFERDIRPLFRESDRDAMSGVFDLWSYDDVNAHSASILGAVETAPGLGLLLGDYRDCS